MASPGRAVGRALPGQLAATGARPASASRQLTADEEHERLFAEGTYPSATTCATCHPDAVPRVVGVAARLRADEPGLQRHARTRPEAHQRHQRRLLHSLPHAGRDEPRRARVHEQHGPPPDLARGRDLRRLPPGQRRPTASSAAAWRSSRATSSSRSTGRRATTRSSA